MQTLMQELWGEVSGFLPAVASATRGYWNSSNSTKLEHREDISVHLHGGTGAPAAMYHPWRNRLLSQIDTPPQVHLPQRVIIRAPHLRHYALLIPQNTDTLEVHAGHSAGGFVCIRRAHTHPTLVTRIILVGTPVNPRFVHRWAKENVAKRILGIDPENLPFYLSALTVLLTSPALLAKTTVIASRDDKFFPPEACYIEGATYIEVRNCSHIGFIYKEVALQALQDAVVQAIADPRVTKRHAA